MTKFTLSRRTFLKSAGAAGALVAVGGGVASLLDRNLTTADGFEGRQSETPRLVPTVCEMCDARCGVLAYVAGGRLIKLEGNYNHSHSLGRICARGVAGLKLLYSPQRLKFPMKRTPEGKFERLTWEKAFAEIGERLKAIRREAGAESLAWAYHAHLSQMWDQQFMRAFGSPNVFTQASKHDLSRTIACNHMLGQVPVADYANSEYIMILGYDPAESIFVSELKAIMEAKEKGARVVSVDPRLGQIAAQSHEWVPIKPGTEIALLLAMVNVVINENLYDSHFVTRYTIGFDSLKSTLSDATPGWASLITGIPADSIQRLARELAASRPACVVDIGFHSTVNEQYSNSLGMARAALSLNALLGNVGSKGGLLAPALNPAGKFQPPPTPAITVKRADGAGGAEYPLASASDGIVQLLPEIILSGKPYPIRGLVVNHHNPVLSLPNTGKVVQALKKLDLLVVIDVQWSETAELAHYILPESSYLERYDPLAGSQLLLPEVALRQPVVKPLYDTKPAYEIVAGMAEAAGLGQYFNFTIDDVLRAQLLPTRMTLERLERGSVWRQSETVEYGVPRFHTESGKIEFYCDRLFKAGLDPISTYQPPREVPDGHAFRLVRGDEALHNGSSTQNNAWLNALSPDNRLWINESRAVRLDIRDGSWVRVKSTSGEVRAKARVTEGIRPEAVFLVHGFGHTAAMQKFARGKGVNDNRLTNDTAEPVSGSAALNETIVTVEKDS